MRREQRQVLVALLAVAVGVAVILALGFLVVYGSTATLPVPAGTAITSQQAISWVVHFSVAPGGGALVGAWTAYNGAGDIGPSLVNGTVPKPQPPPGIYNCPAEFPWTQTNGTLARPLAAGAYTLYWNTFCTSVSLIVVTQTFQVVGP